MKEKPITPYARLMTRAKSLALSVKHPKRHVLWMYPAAKLNELWSLRDLHQRVRAADQLGYDVRLRADDDGLHAEYVQRVDVPWDWA